MKERGQGRPEGAPKEEDRAPQKEQGRGHKESAERQPLPNVWDVLERRVKADECYVGIEPFMPPQNFRNFGEAQEYYREQLEVKRLEEELSEKGTPRDKLILDLFDTITLQLGTGYISFKVLSREEFQQFSSKVDPLSDKEIAEANRLQAEYYIRMGKESGIPGKLIEQDRRKVVFNFSLISSAERAEIFFAEGRATEQEARTEKKAAFRWQRFNTEMGRIDGTLSEGRIIEQEARELYRLNRDMWGEKIPG
jgi:hypothetical protein